MFQRHLCCPRRGATVVECAVVYPLTFLLVLGVVGGGLGVFRYQQVAHLAREGARYAAVRGAQYEVETGQTSPDEQAIRTFIEGQSVDLDTSPQALSVQVVLKVTSAGASGAPVVTDVPWGQSNKATHNVISDNGQARQNAVSVTVTYRWLPEVFLAGPITLSSTATIPMQY
jgi:Flp pilus assembly protein TadG